MVLPVRVPEDSTNTDMDEETRQTLLEVNRRFYEHHAESFSRSRGRAWDGWRRFLPHLGGPARLRVLDAGCGNARLALFLSGAWPGRLDYTGIDASAPLLDAARRRLVSWSTPRLRAQLLEHDLIRQGLPRSLGEFHLIGLFGVLHHVPGQAWRVDLVRQLGRRLKPESLLAVSLWRFDRLARFSKLRLSWRSSSVRVNPSRLEAGDHLLSWGGEAAYPRYCHLTSEAEAEEIVERSGLRLVERFSADGASRDLNHYLLLSS